MKGLLLQRIWRAMGWLLPCGLIACATMPPVIPVQGRIVPPPGQAYVILSTTYQLSSGFGEEGEAGAILQGAGKVVVLPPEPMAEIVAPGQEKNAEGDVHIVALAPGEYRIVRADGVWRDRDDDHRLGFGREQAVVATDYRFQLVAGEVVYVGNLDIQLDNIPSVRLLDQSRRDFNHLREVWKVTDLSNIRVRIAVSQDAKDGAEKK